MVTSFCKWICTLRSLLSVLLLIAMLAFSACAPAENEPATPTPLPTPPLTTYIVQQGEIIQQVVLPGRVQPVLVRPVISQAEGHIGNVYAFPGDLVEKDQVLAELDTLDALQTALDQARQQAEQASEADERVLRRAEINLEIARLRLGVARSQGRSPDELRILKLQVELAQMELEDAQLQISQRTQSTEIQGLETEIANARLLAVMDGQLLEEITAGQSVSPGVEVTTIGDPSRLELVANATDSELGLLTEGMTVTVYLEKNKNVALTGHIRQLPAPYGSGTPITGLAEVLVTIESAPGQPNLTIGDAASITIVLAHLTDALWLPPKAIRSVGGQTFVFFQGPTGPQRVNVTTGIFNREQVQILDGLKAGQVVVAP